MKLLDGHVLKCCCMKNDLWLELLKEDCEIKSQLLEWLLSETDELIAIFVTMSKKVKSRKTKYN